MPTIEHSVKKEAWIELNQMTPEERSEIYEAQREHFYKELDKRRKKARKA